MRLVRISAVGAAWILLVSTAVPATADPAPSTDPGAGPADAAASAARIVDHAAYGLPPNDPAHIASAPPASSSTPDGWTLTVGAKDEVLRTVNPLTTSVASRDYDVSGVFTAMLRGPAGAEPPRGVLEVGYQIGCGIDIGSNGVTMTGSAGVTPSVGLLGVDAVGAIVDGIAPVLSTPVTGGMAIGLKPGVIHTVRVGQKEFTGFDPWVSVNGFRVKVDGCVGESFIRSYAVLTHSTDQSDSIRGYYGTTRKV